MALALIGFCSANCIVCCNQPMVKVLSIIHIAICIPMIYLAGNTKDLAAFNFGYYDMGIMLDLIEECFEGIVEDGVNA